METELFFVNNNKKMSFFLLTINEGFDNIVVIKEEKREKMESKSRIKQIDELGRIVIPKDIRKNLGILPGDELEISLSGEDILIKKTLNRCAFCNASQELIQYKNAYICKACLGDIVK